MKKPSEGARVRVKFVYMGKETECPATYTNNKFVIAFYSALIPVEPISWVLI